MLFDYHLHSHFSPDSEMRLEELCRAAVKKDLDEIAITDHHDPDYQDNSIEFLIDKEKYLKEIEKMQQKYRGKLTIKKGIEIGLQSDILNQCRDYLAADFDFVIASFHTVEKADLHNGDFFKGYTQWQSYLQYLKTVLEVIKNYDHYNVIGHLDIIRRYGNFKTKPDLLENLEAEKLVREILKVLISKNKGLEVNSSGFRLDGKNPLPSFKILEIYYQLGGRILSIGSDSHRTVNLAYKFDYIKAKLKKIGFKELVTFANMEPIFHKI